MEMALGSSFELETQLIVIEELSIISDEDIKVILEQLNKEQKMISNPVCILVSTRKRDWTCHSGSLLSRNLPATGNGFPLKANSKKWK